MVYKVWKGIQKGSSIETVERLFDTVIGEDNQACIVDAQNDRLSDLSKHVYLKYQVLFDHVRRENVRLKYVPSKNMVADILSENLLFSKFNSVENLRGIEWVFGQFCLRGSDRQFVTL